DPFESFTSLIDELHTPPQPRTTHPLYPVLTPAANFSQTPQPQEPLVTATLASEILNDLNALNFWNGRIHSGDHRAGKNRQQDGTANF
ncbi:MAG: hypothetical protein L3J79_12975, partial [Candidatus Marinimicrobia bacterium]|nr:hypothetical protein [Candidatus Neomarinimicrobiota bacterium]